MTTNKTIESSSARDQANYKWLQVTPGERLRIRVSSAQTMGSYSLIEVVVDPHNGVPLHIHEKEEEHFIVLDGTLDIAVGNRRWGRRRRFVHYRKKGRASRLVQSIGDAPAHAGGVFAGPYRGIVQSGCRCRRRRQDCGHCCPLR